jgi:AbrB family looped-hinge helix DNA binding protein
MEVTMDAAGRLVIPREIRREAALEPGVALDIRWRDGVIELEPKPLPVTLHRKGRLLVATPAADAAPLRAATVERTRRALRRSRRPRR